MAGIYIHIPFCKQKCHYCNFFSVATLKHKNDFISALKKEILLQKDYLNNNEIQSIYFGGGTPSLLDIVEFEEIFSEINKYHNISKNAEITIEANPDDLNPITINELSKSIFNRLSIGVQSFFDDDLKYLNRIHQSKQAIQAIKNCQNAGFKNISIDLIYGIPTLSTVKWQKNLEMFFALNIPHLSAYSLTIEAKTTLDILIKKKKVRQINETESIENFNALINLCETNNFIHYEISNFSKKGYYSKHNSSYWLGANYLGLGPSAHSYNGTSRQWNIAQISEYITLNSNNPQIFEKEILTEKQRYNEYVMTSLRTSWGCNIKHIENVFGKSYHDHFLKTVIKFINEQKIEQKESVFLLTNKGKLFADGIAAELFL